MFHRLRHEFLPGVSARHVLAPALLLATVLSADAGSPAQASLPDTFLARLEALATMQTLNAELLASRSATRTLERWCASHAIAADPVIVAIRVPGPDKPIDDTQRRRLQIGAGEEVRYRHVRLMCGSHVLSEADNWYLPARLTSEMNHLLETTDTPFGKAVAPLQPTRQTFAAEVLWPVLPDGWEHRPRPPDHPDQQLDVPAVLFEHHAVLYDGERRPFSEVDEHYTRDILGASP